jgi:hypothetical protein
MNNKRYDQKSARREEAQKREEAWRALTPQAQLYALDSRLGHGVGAKKQRARLAKKK